MHLAFGNGGGCLGAGCAVDVCVHSHGALYAPGFFSGGAEEEEPLHHSLDTGLTRCGVKGYGGDVAGGFPESFVKNTEGGGCAVMSGHGIPAVFEVQD